MKRILLLATGGTIASTESGQGLKPALSAVELLKSIHEISSVAEVASIQLMNLDSTNITPDHWLVMANAIQRNYDSYDGFVITHGTDTMAYTAAALSYLIQASPKPIVITGAQKPALLSDTDARRNLINSFIYACDAQSHDVSVVFDGHVILGTRAKKERSKSYHAFSSVDYPEEAVIRDGTIIRYLTPKRYSKSSKPIFYQKLDPHVLMVTLIPGIDAAVLRLLKEHYHALICQSFGVGGIPGGGEGALAEEIGKWIECGKVVVVMTQVPYEGSDMNVYQVGKQVKAKYNIIEARNMTMEAVTTKLMWAIGNACKPEDIGRLFRIPVRHDVI